MSKVSRIYNKITPIDSDRCEPGDNQARRPGKATGEAIDKVSG